MLSEVDTVEHFKDLPFYKKPIEKPKIKWLKNINQLVELLFYMQLSVTKLNQTLYGMSYKVELIEKKDPIVQLKARKSSIKDFFSDLLSDSKGFKYQITVQVLLKKNTSLMEKLNLLQFILIPGQKQW